MQQIEIPFWIAGSALKQRSNGFPAALPAYRLDMLRQYCKRT
jgi:hypothetical protein